ncbi:aminopeptidase P family protein [Parafilimonas terrae]|uniref:Xaa-Pro aminopeptidase n=1 Tax=Parafilimonas terrae TaxID=1465490 RepID=A0A1I5TEV7_9BACT|nr:aminopeptidase P family protein [Parafilimonas terrae]SFP81569.1 Xaa-Pro aminopeptidase [Parafilimonas terrae]
MNNHLFDKEIYISRRKRLAENVGGGLIVLLGNEDSPMNYADNCFPFRQNSTFLYYFGLDVPMLAAIIDVDNSNEIIFGNDVSMDDIIWTGPLPSIAALAANVGVTATQPYHKIEAAVQTAKSKQQPVHILPPYRAENKIKLSQWLDISLNDVSQSASLKLIKAVIAQRECKEACEVEQLNNAVSISADMHLAAMQLAKPGMMEYEVAAKVEAIALANNGRLSYPIILTVNGQTLHNHYHGNKLKEGDMVLMDAGAENAMHYAGDLTRTFPAGKTFSTRQKEMYNVVLASLNHATQLLKPGIEFREIHRQASIKLLEGLKQLGLVKGNAEEAVHAGVHTLFFQCGVGHAMGLDVHDMEDLGEQYVGYTDALKKSREFGWKSLRLAKQLKPGFVLTVEPGLYFIPELIDRWKAENKLNDFINYDVVEQYRNFTGIRIEDNYLITDEGSQKLGKHLIKEADEIEAIRQNA